MNKTFYFYKGDIDFTPFEFDDNTTLDQIRNNLIASGFMTPSESTDKFRFINYQNTSLKYEDMVVGIGTEKYIPLRGVAGINDQTYLTDVSPKKKTDFIGFSTDWWFDRYMSCRMRLNTTDTEAKNANKGKFQPFMLTNVKTADPDLPGQSFENIVVCEKDSIIQFDIGSWAAAGYGYTIKPTSGSPINSTPLYRTYTTCPKDGGNYGKSSLRCYFTKNESQHQSTIKVVATHTLDIGGKELNYMKFSIRTWKVTEYKSGGKVYKCNLPLPVPYEKEFVAKSTSIETPYTKLVNGDESIIPGTTIEPGTTVPTGTQSEQNFGTIYNVKDSQSPENIIGEVIFYVFVFKTKEDADAVFGKMNDIDPSIWMEDEDNKE